MDQPAFTFNTRNAIEANWKSMEDISNATSKTQVTAKPKLRAESIQNLQQEKPFFTSFHIPNRFDLEVNAAQSNAAARGEYKPTRWVRCCLTRNMTFSAVRMNTEKLRYPSTPAARILQPSFICPTIKHYAQKQQRCRHVTSAKLGESFILHRKDFWWVLKLKIFRTTTTIPSCMANQ